MFKTILKQQGIRFRQFSHKAYAAFCSLHREVTIGRVAAYMTDLEMLKSGKSIAVSALLLFSGIAAVEADEGVPKDSVPLEAQQLSLQEVLVVSHKAEVNSEAYRLITQVSQAEIEALPIQTVADILQYLPGVDVRTRGANGAQADISMRGGTFDQVLVLLNGVPLSDFHTGHYALNIPVSTEMIERVEVLQGTSANLHGAFSGAINIVTKTTPPQPSPQGREHDVRLKLTAGMNGLVNPEIAATFAIPNNNSLPCGEGRGGVISWSADWYYRWGKNIIDWVYVPTDTKRPFHAENQQQVNATGLELSLAYRLNEWLRCVSVDYAYTYLDLDLKEAGSRYLDYLSHKLAIHLEHGIYKGLGASWTVRFQKREGQYNNAEGEVADYQPVWLLDGSVYWQNKYLRVSADCTNMTNTRYYDYGGILQPGAWAKVSIKAKLY